MARRVGTLLLVLVGGVVAFAAPAQAEAPAATALRLTVTSTAASYAPGEPVILQATVINTSSAACDMVDLPDGGLVVTSAQHDGTALVPTYGRLRLVNGIAGEIAEHTRSVAPAERVSFTVDDPRAIAAVTPLRDGTGLLASYPTTATGAYEFHLAYHVPTLAGAHACHGSSDEVTVRFTVGTPPGSGPGSRLVWYLLAGAAAIVIVVAAALMLRGRSRRRRTIAGAAVLLLAVAGLSVVDARPAQAYVDTQFLPSDVQTIYSGCITQIIAYDPSLWARVNAGPPPLVEIFERAKGDSESDSVGHNTAIHWNAKQKGSFFGDPGLAQIDPCAELYHELVHAYDATFDALSDRYCDNTGISFDEVRATFRENAYRLAHQMFPRTTYLVNGTALPLPSLDLYKQLGLIHGSSTDELLEDYCFHLFPPKKRPTQIPMPKPVPKQRHCGAVACGNSNGDPHLFTFDQGYYDFQAVGEFVAARSSTKDLEVQVRQAPYLNSRLVAVNSAIAIRVATTRLGFYLDPGGLTVYRDGVPVAVSMGETPLPGGAALERRYDLYTGDVYLLRWPDGTQVSVNATGLWGLSLSVAAAAGRAGTIDGLLGNDDGKAADDVPTVADRYHAFADRWRVTDATSLFDYGPGQNTASFTDRGFPDHPTAVADLTGPARDLAEQTCAAQQLTDQSLIDACVLDVALTGQAAFSVGAGDTEDGAFTDPAEPTPIEGPTGAVDVDGAATVVAVGQPGESSRLTFHATKDEQVTVDISASTLPDSCTPFTLRAPDGTPLRSSCVLDGKGLMNAVTLPADGTYAIVLDPPGRAIGSALVRVYRNNAQVGQIEIGGPSVTLTNATPGSVARVTFTATAGQKVFVDVLSSTLPDSCFPLSVREPGDDASIGYGCLVKDGYVDGTVLPVSGQYSVVMDPPDTQTGTTTLRLLAVTDQSGPIVVNGPAVTATIAAPGAVARFSFTGTAGQKVGVDVTGATLADECSLGLYNVDGRIAFGCLTGGSGSIPATVLPKSGEYTIVIDPGARHIGTAQVRLHS